MAGLERVVAGKALALDRAMASGSASTTTKTMRASMDPTSIPTWGLIRRITARVGITSEVDKYGTVAMAGTDGMDPTAKVAIFSDTCHIRSCRGSSKGPPQ